jgi:hypothetical protein
LIAWHTAIVDGIVIVEAEGFEPEQIMPTSDGA